jgi:hypothetical protein
MTIINVQHNLGADGSTAQAITVVLTGSVVASGNLVVGSVQWGTGAGETLVSVTDDKLNTYNISSNVNDATATQAQALFWLPNVTNGPSTITATFSSVVTSFRRILWDEFSGVATSPLDGTTGQVLAGTLTANGMTSGNISTTANGDLVWGAATDTFGAGATWSAGTGFTLLDAGSPANNAPMYSEWQVQSSSGSIAATFTQTGTASESIVAVIAFKASASGSVGSAVGAGAATGVGKSTVAAVGTSVGAGTATAVGSGVIAVATQASVARLFTPLLSPLDRFRPNLAFPLTVQTVSATGSSSGVGAASGVGASTAASVGSSSGAGTATGVGISTDASVGTASGAGTASGIGSSIATAVGTSSGTGTATGVGTSTGGGSTGSSVGAGTASGVGASIAASVGTSAGIGIATGIGAASIPAVGTSSGSGTASGVGASTAASVGASSGAGTASGVATSAAASVGTSSGAGTASGVGTSSGGVTSAVGTASGAGNANGVGSSIAAAVGTSSGTGNASAVSFGTGIDTHDGVWSEKQLKKFRDNQKKVALKRERLQAEEDARPGRIRKLLEAARNSFKALEVVKEPIKEPIKPVIARPAVLVSDPVAKLKDTSPGLFAEWDEKAILDDDEEIMMILGEIL